MGLISKKATLHVQHTFLYISLPLFWRLQRETSRHVLFTCFMETVSSVFLLTFFFHCRSVSPWWLLASRRYKISCCSSNRKCLLCFLSLALAPFLVELRWPVALLSLFLCLSFSLYSKFVDMTINLSLILKTTRIQKHFPLSVFVFIDSLLCLLHKTRVAIRFPAKITWHLASAYM